MNKFTKLVTIMAASVTMGISAPVATVVNNNVTANASTTKEVNVNTDTKFSVPANSKKNVLLKVPYVSQYRPINAPWGCAEASLTMLLRSAGSKVDLAYIYRHTPMVPTKGGQKGNVYTGAGFGHVIKAGALTKYAHHWNKKVHNISGASTTDIKRLVQSGHPVLFYGYSSYQRPADLNRNHCRVITGYKNGQFRVFDPLYFSANGAAGTQGRNMTYDRGAISWYSIKRFNFEYAHQGGANRKCALSVY